LPRISYQDTICALATPAGLGAVAIVRISGPDARALAERHLRKADGKPVTLRSHRVHAVNVVDSDGKPVDEAIALYFAAPRSFTREDVVEIQGHGSPVVVRRVLALLMAAGARMAEPGEFTRRAFLNGRLGLAEAEAVNDLVHAPSDSVADLALEQLHGSLRERIGSLRARLIDLCALIEANMDFPEEDIEILDREDVKRQVTDIRARVEELADSYERGRLLRGGIRTLIAGRPNAGKSSLLNVLLKSERAIVTAIPGTTRDTIEESFAHRGVLWALIDSAGLRDTAEPVEAIGVQRARELMQQADLVLYLIDGAAGATAEERALLEDADPRRFQLVLNKSDLPRGDGDLAERFARLRPVRIAATGGEGLDALLDVLHRRAVDELIPAPKGALITSERHRDALRSAGAALARFAESLERAVPLDVSLVDLYDASSALGHIIGEVVTEDILDRVFERFCIGK
jgi:tRNA modification GTPase